MNDFLQELNDGIIKLKQGDPFDNNTTTAPMAMLDLSVKLYWQMKQSIQLGAQLINGGGVSGCNFPPSLLMNVKKGMPVFDQETFGPLGTVITASDETEAIAIANDSSYGLCGSIWTGDMEKGISMARKIQSGSVFINSLVKTDPKLLFGGIKKSGSGKEPGREGMLEFVNAKIIAASA